MLVPAFVYIWPALFCLRLISYLIGKAEPPGAPGTLGDLGGPQNFLCDLVEVLAGAFSAFSNF